MPRPKNQDARRAQLIQATLETIATHGLSGVSLKNIAETARISPRLVPYYYPDMEALVAAAHHTATDRYYWSRKSTLEDDATPPEKLARLMQTGLPRVGDELLSQVLNEMSVSAARNPVHATAMALLFDWEVSLYAAVLETGSAAGDFDLTGPTDVLSRNFVALEDALGLHVLARNSTMTLEQAEDQLASYARAATGKGVRPAASPARNPPAVPGFRLDREQATGKQESSHEILSRDS